MPALWKRITLRDSSKAENKVGFFKRPSILVGAAAIVLLALMALTAAGIYLNSAAGRRHLLAIIRPYLNGTLTIAEHHVAPLGGRLRLKTIELRDRRGGLLFSAERVTIAVDYAALLRRVIYVKRLDVQRAYLTIDYDEEDRFALESLLADADPATPQTPAAEQWRLVIADGVISDSVIDYRRPRLGRYGRVTGIDLHGRLDTAQSAAKVTLAVGRLEWRDAQRSGAWETLKVEAAYIPGDEAPLQLMLTTPGADLTFLGAVQPMPDPVDIQGVLEFTLDVAAFNALLGQPVAMAGQARGRLTLQGRLTAPQLDLTATIVAGHAYGIPFARIDGRFQLQGDQLTIAELSGAAPWGEVALQGGVDLTRGELAVQVDASATTLAFLEAPLGKRLPEGRLTLRGEAVGKLARPTLTTHIVAADLNYERWHAQHLALDIRLTPDGTLSLDRLDLRHHAARITGRGTVGLWDGDGRLHTAPPLTARLDLHDVAAADLGVPPLIDGVLNGRLTLDQTLWAPAVRLTLAPTVPYWHSLSMQVDGDPTRPPGRVFAIEGTKIGLGPQILERAAVKGRLLDDRLEVERLSVVIAAGQELQGHGWYGWDQRFACALQSERIELSAVPPLQTAGPLAGLVSLTVSGAGTLRDPHVTARATLADLNFRGQPFDDVHLDARLAGASLSLAVDQDFKLQAATDLSSGEFTVAADFAATDLTPYLNLAGPPRVAERFSGRLGLTGNRRQASAVNGRLDIATLDITDGPTRLLAAQATYLSVREGLLDLPGLKLTLLDQGFVELRAAGDWRRDDMSITLEGQVPLAALAPYSDRLEAVDGEVRLHGAAHGPLAGLRWSAALEFEQVAFAIPGLLQKVQELNGRVRLGVDELAIEELAGRIDNGAFRLNGQVRLHDWQPIDGRITWQAEALPLYWPDTADVLIGGDLELRGDMQQATLAGSLRLIEGIYYKNFRLNLLAAITGQRRPATPASSGAKPAWMHRIALNIDLGYRQPFLVDNNLARMNIAPDFKIGGTLAEPLINGRATVSDGEIIYRGKSFQITHGVVDMVNPYKNEPLLDIAAQTTIGRYAIDLAVSGKPEQLSFTMHSNPPLSDSDILSLVLIGRTTGEFSSSAGTGPSPSRMLTALAAAALGEDLKQRTGVDILEIETGAREGDSQSPDDRLQVTVGKRLNERLTVKYEVETSGGERVQRAVSEYRFMENMLAKGFQDSVGAYGGELVYRLEFR